MKQPVYRNHSPATAPPEPGASSQQSYSPPDPAQRPGIVDTWKRYWMVLLAAEVLHQIINLVMSILSRDELVYGLQELNIEQDGQLPDNLLLLSAIISAVVMFLIAIGILWYAACAVRWVHVVTKRASVHLRFLSFFAIYVVLRGILVFFADPTGAIPVAFYAVDGCLRICIGVLGVMVLWAGNKRELLQWVGIPLPDESQSKPPRK